MIQPNSSGLMMPPILKPVETMPKARPAAPGGTALRTSMSREGAITPPRNPALPIAMGSSSGGDRGGPAGDPKREVEGEQNAAALPGPRVGAGRKTPGRKPPR